MVKLNITGPDSNSVNISITGNKTGDMYYCNQSYSMLGTYTFFVWAEDAYGNANISAVYTFNIKNLYSDSLVSHWNLIGLPFNETVDKIDLIIVNNSILYSWEDAVDNDIILGFIYGYNRSSDSYEVVDSLIPGYGYWLFAYQACDIWR